MGGFEDEANLVHREWGIRPGHDSDLRAHHIPDNGAPSYTSRPKVWPSLFRRAHNSRGCHWCVVANRSLFSSDWLASTQPKLSLFHLPANSSGRLIAARCPVSAPVPSPWSCVTLERSPRNREVIVMTALDAPRASWDEEGGTGSSDDSV